jgi:sec-independent protein translocase protein TatC
MALVPFPEQRLKVHESAFDGLFAHVPLLQVLEDVRRRLIRSAVAICVGVLVGVTFIDRIIDVILAPTRRVLPSGTHLIYTEPGEAFGLYIQVALIIGVAIAMPYMMFQLWRMVTPWMPVRVRRSAIPFALFTTLGFLGGATFTHYIAFPYMMAFFSTFDTPDLRFMPRLDDVFGLYTKMLLGMGAVFQMPTAIFFLAKAGLVSARLLWRSFRYALLLIFIVAAVITPTGDMVTQTIFAAPMVALYMLSIAIAWVFGRKPTREPAPSSAREPR